jgi:parvulin-like peptidyl-prolyl isomerase
MKRHMIDRANEVSLVGRTRSGGGEGCATAAVPRWRAWPMVGLSLLLLWGSAVAAGRGEVVARGKGFEIRQGEVDDLVVEQKVLLRGARQAVRPEDEALLEERTLERLVVREILLRMATSEERERARRMVDESLAAQKVRLGSEEAYRRQLFKSGTTPEVFAERMLAQSIADQVIARELRSQVEVTEEQVRRYYDEGEDVRTREARLLAERLGKESPGTTAYRDATNRLATLRQTNLERLVRPEQARARMLVLFTRDPLTRRPLSEDLQRTKRERAERLRQRALAGEDFGALAAEFSEEPDAARNRAEYMATRSEVTFPELRQALFTLPVGQLSDVLRTELGYYVVEVLERPTPGKVSFEEAREDIREHLRSQETEQRMPAWFERIKREYEVEIIGR